MKLNEKLIEKNIVRASCFTYVSPTKTTIMPMENNVIIGDKLSIVDNAVVIGEGVSKVLISANGQFTSSSSSYTMNVEIDLLVNGENVNDAVNYVGASKYASCAFSGLLKKVVPGDKLQLQLWNNSSGDYTVRGKSTWFTVEVIE